MWKDCNSLYINMTARYLSSYEIWTNLTSAGIAFLLPVLTLFSSVTTFCFKIANSFSILPFSRVPQWILIVSLFSRTGD